MDSMDGFGSKTKKLTFLALAASFAIVLGYIETLLPMPFPIPYIKLGLANVVIVTVMYTSGAKDAFFISLVKILSTSLLFSGVGALPYSLAGGMASIAAMSLLKKSGLFGIIGVSAAGGVFHMLCQLIVASLIIENITLSFFLAPLLIAGALTGLSVGTVSLFSVRRIKWVYAGSTTGRGKL